MIKIILLLLVSITVVFSQSSENLIKEAVYAYEDDSLVYNYTLVSALEKLAQGDGNVDAAFLLATAYKNGRLQERANNNALKWYKIAASLNDHDAELMIGWLYYEGRVYLKKDVKEAKKWFKKASDSGLLEATQMYNMLENF